jgi:hypothetical protein
MKSLYKDQTVRNCQGPLSENQMKDFCPFSVVLCSQLVKSEAMVHCNARMQPCLDQSYFTQNLRF